MTRRGTGGTMTQPKDAGDGADRNESPPRLEPISSTEIRRRLARLPDAKAWLKGFNRIDKARRRMGIPRADAHRGNGALWAGMNTPGGYGTAWCSRGVAEADTGVDLSGWCGGKGATLQEDAAMDGILYDMCGGLYEHEWEPGRFENVIKKRGPLTPLM